MAPTRETINRIYVLLEELCQNEAGHCENLPDIVARISQFMSTCPIALKSTLPYDEATVVAKITQMLSTRKDTDDGREGENNVSLFLSINEQLKCCHFEWRLSAYNFLYMMAKNNPVWPVDTRFRQTANNGSFQPLARSVSSMQTTTTFVSSGQYMPLTHRSNSEDTSSLHSNSIARTLAKSDPNKPDPNKQQNEEVIQNAIYAFTGIPGKYLKKDIISGRFKLETRAQELNIVQAGMLLRLSELGYYHDVVRNYTDDKNGLCALGLMGQGFVSAIKQEITRYYGFVSMLQEQLNQQREQPQTEHMPYKGVLMPTVSAVSINLPHSQSQLTLLKLLVWYMEPLQRFQWLAKIAKACVEKKGGVLASIVHSYMGQGQMLVKSLAKELLLAICGPLYQMLLRWLLEGELMDPHSEFFIECFAEVGLDRLWHDKYRVRTAMLPDFISLELAHKLLVIGKSINFLNEICKDKQPMRGREDLRRCIEDNAEHIFSHAADTRFHSTIDDIYLRTSKRILDIVMGTHKLMEHLQAMRRYLLLGQGDFINILMENLQHKLNKAAKELYTYDLSSIMDNAIRATNAYHDDPEILNHLDLRLLAPCDGDVGWDILVLQYTVRGPLATMLESSMGVYQTLFKPLWRMKHMEFLLSSKIWKNQKCNAKILRSMNAELRRVTYRLHLFTSEMIHFIHQMQYYVLFEVIECSWVELQTKVQQATTLDEILNAHDGFLNTIRCGFFLDATSDNLCLYLENVYDGIVRLEIWQDKFYELCFKEQKARKEYELNIVASEAAGEFGLTTEKKLQRDQEAKIFEQYLHSYEKSLENIGIDYEKAVRNFILTLNSDNDDNLRLFGIRLDFNEYYKKRDQRLSQPLTFEHMRSSNVFANSNNRSLLGGSRLTSII